LDIICLKRLALSSVQPSKTLWTKSQSEFV
jgi:hypothetical protein